MKNFPRKLDSKTTSLRITVPENLDLALEGLIRKVLKEQPKTDDIYSFAADYFETLLKIRDKAGTKYMASQICSFHNDEDAHEMIKMANSFPKPRTARTYEGKHGQDSGRAVSSGKSIVTKEPEIVSLGSRIAGDKRKPPVERIKSTTSAKSRTVPRLATPIVEAVTKPSPQEPNANDEKEDKPVTEPESNLQDIDEDEEFLKSDPIKELVERELMSKTAQNDINRDEGQPSTDMTENEKLESEKAVDKVPKVIESRENGKLKEELESKENKKNEGTEGEPTATDDELCGVVDVLSISSALESGNETATIQKEENEGEINLNESETGKPEEGGQAIETPKPAAGEAVKETDESTPEKPELVTDENVENLKEEKPEDDDIVQQEEDIEKKEVKDEGEKPNESTDIVQEGKEQIKEIKDEVDDTEDVKDRSEEDAEDDKSKPKESAKGTLENDTEDNKNRYKDDAKDNRDMPKEGAEDVGDKLKDAEDIKDRSKSGAEDNTDKANDGAEDIKDKLEEDAKDIKDKFKEDAEDNNDKPKEGEEDIKENPKDAEDIKGASTEKEETDTTANQKEEETPSDEKPNDEVKETEDTIETTQEAEKDTDDISQTNTTAIPDGAKKESATEEKQKEEMANQTSLPEDKSPQEETAKEEISNEKPLTDSKEPIDNQEEEEIKRQPISDELLKTTQSDIMPTTENNDETKVETKEQEEVKEVLQKTEEISTSLDERNQTTETDIEKPKGVNETHSPDKEVINQKPENAEENPIKDVVATDETLKETEEGAIEKEETKPPSELIMTKEDEEETGKSNPEEETGTKGTEDATKGYEAEKLSSETDQQDDKPEKPETIMSTEEEPVGDKSEDKRETEIEVQTAKPVEEKPEPIDQEKTENKPEEVRMESEHLSTETEVRPEVEITETGIEVKEKKESEESKQQKAEEKPEEEISPGSELKADGEALDEKAVPEVEVEATEGKFKSDEVNETEKLPTQVDTKVNKEPIAVATPDKHDKNVVEDERQKTANDENESKTKTEETQQTEETKTENLKDEEKILSRQDDGKEGNENETTDGQTENKTKEIVEENKPEDITDQAIVTNEEKTETHEPITEATAEGELSTVVDTQNLMNPETEKREDEITIKTITTHYYDLLQVPTTVTKEYKVHRTQDTPHDLSNVGNTIIKSYQLVKELTSDGGDNNNNNNQQTVSQDISPDIGLTNQTQETAIEPDIPKDEIEGLNAIPTSSELYTMHELFLDSERKLSSYQKEGPKLSSLKTAKRSLEDTKILTESPKTPPADEDKQEVEEVITKTVIPRIPEAVPVPPRQVEEINAGTNAEQTDNIKDKKEDDKPDTNSSEDSNEPTDSSNNGRSIDSDVPIISVEVRTVIETQILDDDEEANEDTQKGSDYRTELTLTDGSNDLNVEVEATIQLPLETTDTEKGHNQNLTDQEKARQQTKQQTNTEEPSPEKTEIKPSNDDSEPRGSSTVRDGSSGESDSTILTTATEIKRFDSARKNFARSSTQDLLTSQSLDSGKRPPLLKTRSLSVFRQGVTDFEIWNTIEKELEEAATKIQSKYRGYTVRKRLRREDAVQITTEESSVSTTPGEQEPRLDGDDLRTTGEFHDSIVLSIHPR